MCGWMSVSSPDDPVLHTHTHTHYHSTLDARSRSGNGRHKQQLQARLQASKTSQSIRGPHTHDATNNLLTPRSLWSGRQLNEEKTGCCGKVYV